MSLLLNKQSQVVVKGRVGHIVARLLAACKLWNEYPEWRGVSLLRVSLRLTSIQEIHSTVCSQLADQPARNHYWRNSYNNIMVSIDTAHGSEISLSWIDKFQSINCVGIGAQY